MEFSSYQCSILIVTNRHLRKYEDAIFLNPCDCQYTTTRSTALNEADLNEQILSCKKCRLWQGAKNAVIGEGPANAKVMLVGQNPGEEEDKVGRPFIGRSGKFLNKVLAKNGMRREDCS